MGTIAIIVLLVIVLWNVVKIRSAQKKHIKLADDGGIMMDDFGASKERKVDEKIDKFASFLKRGTRKVMS